MFCQNGIFRHNWYGIVCLQLWVVKRVELLPIPPCHASLKMQPFKVAEEDVVFDEDEVLIIRVFGEDVPEDLYVGMEHALEVPSIRAIQMVLIEILAYSCSDKSYFEILSHLDTYIGDQTAMLELW